MDAPVEQLKERARATWSAGDFDDIAQMFPGVGQKVADSAQVEPGMKVLDVACGTGAATIPAALAGGVCTGVDLIPEMFDAARKHAAEAGVEIEWVQGDAEALPFADASFDRLMSQFGVMFAPQHELAAAELARVCAPGGLVVVASWTPEGMVGDMFKIIGSRMPTPPSNVKPPVLWGTEEHVRALLEPHGMEVGFERAMAIFRAESVTSLVDRFETYYGPWIMAKAALGETWAEVRADLIDLYDRSSEATADGIDAFGEYLLVLARKPA